MDYIDQIFTRADIKQIRSFLLDGQGEPHTDERTYMERLKSADEKIYERMHEEYPELKEFDEMTQLIFDRVGVSRDVYLEIGLQIGFSLAAQINSSLKRTAYKGD